MFDIRDAADVTSSDSLSNKLRDRRFQAFRSLVEQFPKPLNIIDVGGTAEFWVQRGWEKKDGIYITAVNINGSDYQIGNVSVMQGDATYLSGFADKQFDVAFSNSVIEHLFNYENQKKMAGEIKRIAKAYWVQTPNYWFPIEPHFLFPGWQWLPISIRIRLIRQFRCGWRGPQPDYQKARDLVSEVRLLTKSEMRELFSEAVIWEERFLGLTKSIVAYSGFEH